MQGKFKDLTGMTFGYWQVLERTNNSKDGSSRWVCRCKCGATKTVLGKALTSQKTKSCGCYNKEKAKETFYKHGYSHTNLHNRWLKIRERCYNPNSRSFENYGGRGIQMCNEWKQNFMRFYSWAIENGYKPGLTIDRIDVNGNYEPKNCRFINQKGQQNNRRNNVYITYKNKTQTLAQWADYYNIPYKILWKRIKLGWTFEKAISTQIGGKNERRKEECLSKTSTM